MGQSRKRVNRNKSRKRKQAILLMGILVVVGIFVGIKFIPRHKQENVQITNPGDNQSGTSNNKDELEDNKDKVDNNKLDNSGYLSFEEDPNADDAAMVAENTKGLLNGTKPVKKLSI